MAILSKNGYPNFRICRSLRCTDDLYLDAESTLEGEFIEEKELEAYGKCKFLVGKKISQALCNAYSNTRIKADLWSKDGDVISYGFTGEEGIVIPFPWKDDAVLLPLTPKEQFYYKVKKLSDYNEDLPVFKFNKKVLVKKIILIPTEELLSTGDSSITVTFQVNGEEKHCIIPLIDGSAISYPYLLEEMNLSLETQKVEITKVEYPHDGDNRTFGKHSMVIGCIYELLADDSMEEIGIKKQKIINVDDIGAGQTAITFPTFARINHIEFVPDSKITNDVTIVGSDNGTDGLITLMKLTVDAEDPVDSAIQNIVCKQFVIKPQAEANNPGGKLIINYELVGTQIMDYYQTSNAKVAGKLVFKDRIYGTVIGASSSFTSSKPNSKTKISIKADATDIVEEGEDKILGIVLPIKDDEAVLHGADIIVSFGQIDADDGTPLNTTISLFLKE